MHAFYLSQLQLKCLRNCTLIVVANQKVGQIRQNLHMSEDT